MLTGSYKMHTIVSIFVATMLEIKRQFQTRSIIVQLWFTIADDGPHETGNCPPVSPHIPAPPLSV